MLISDFVSYGTYLIIPAWARTNLIFTNFTLMPLWSLTRHSWVFTKGPISFVEVSLPVSQNATLVKILGNIINNLGHQNFQKMAT